MSYLGNDPLSAPTNSVVKTATKNLADASTTQSITGVGFTPSSVDIIGGIHANSVCGSHGMSDGVNTYSFRNTSTTQNQFLSGLIAYLSTAAGAAQQATITLTADGCDLAWTKVGAPTGTANLMLRFHR